eukprot:2651705-Pleurochrysis_carterae.AAC.4
MRRLAGPQRAGSTRRNDLLSLSPQPPRRSLSSQYRKPSAHVSSLVQQNAVQNAVLIGCREVVACRLPGGRCLSLAGGSLLVACREVVVCRLPVGRCLSLA